jgi:glutamate/tyrosine decarboxylase-like PLP-dependent enzyme
LWAAASQQRRALVAGVEQADSWATDAHKWLNAPYDSGIAICAREEDLRRSFAADAAYLLGESGRVLMHLGVQMSQRARGVEAWAIIASRGRSGIAEIVDTCCDLAQELAALLEAQGARLLAPVVLNQALVHFTDDATTDKVIAAVQRDGTCWAGGTTWQGQRAMRISVSDVATTPDDIAESAHAILRCWKQFENDK